MITRRSLLAAVAAPVLAPFAPFAGDDTSKKTPVTVQRSPISPPAVDGYADILRAGKRLKESKTEYEFVQFTLARKRTYLADPASQDALVLVRQAVAKPITFPVVESFDTLLYEPFSAYHRLSQLLAVEVAVSFVDGRNDVAVQTVADGLTLARSVKSSTWLGELVGAAVDDCILTAAVKERERWTESDCDELFRLAGQWLAMPNPIFEALDMESKLFQKAITGWREKPEDIIHMLKEREELEEQEEEEEPKPSRKIRAFAKSLRNSVALRERVLTECLRANEECHEQIRVLIDEPTRRMVLVPSAASASWHPITHYLREGYALDASAAQHAVESRVRFQLLGVHAAIRRFRWANNRLPETLGEMGLAPHLVTDPFTAKSLLYKPGSTGAEYELASAGGLVPGEDGKPDARWRFTLPTEKRKP